MRDNYWSPPPTADSTTPFNQADPSLLTPNRREFDTEYPAWRSPSPSTTNFQHNDKSEFSSRRSLYPELAGFRFDPPRSKPLFRGFERPSLARIAILIVLCLTAYPALYILTLVARDKSLFTVRFIVAIWCSAVGFALGYILLRIGVQHLEATSEFTLFEYHDLLRLCLAWATVIHMSYEGGGMKLRDLARNSHNPTNFLAALRIFRSRFGTQETARRSRKSYESVPKFSSAPRHLIFLQHTTMVTVLRVLHRPRHIGSFITFPLWPYHGDQNFRPRTYHKSASVLYLPNI
jgi:hypothetical protein